MSFSFKDHGMNRVASVSLNHFLNNTIGAAIKTAAELAGVPSHKSRSIASHAVNVAQAALDGMRGEHFDGIVAVRSFVTAELNGIVDDHFDPAAADYDEHLYALTPYKQDEFKQIIKSRAVRETLNLISGYLQVVIDEERKRGR